MKRILTFVFLATSVVSLNGGCALYDACKPGGDLEQQRIQQEQREERVDESEPMEEDYRAYLLMKTNPEQWEIEYRKYRQCCDARKAAEKVSRIINDEEVYEPEFMNYYYESFWGDRYNVYEGGF